MAGSVSASTAALIAAGVGAAGTTAGIVQGMSQSGAQQDALKSQTQAQSQAQSSALATQRQGEEAQAAANQKTPDITQILARAAQAGKGLGSTMLTGPGGVDTSGLNLGKGTTLLGS